MGKLVLVIGGIRSGKTNFAQELAEKSETVTYLASALAEDDEMKQRINTHKLNRPSNWQTVELSDQPIDICLKQCSGKTVIVDCLGNLIARSMEKGTLDNLIKNFDTLLSDNKDQFDQLIIVSNEVGLSLVSAHKSGRDFSDAIGLINQKIAKIAEEVHLVTAGIPIQIK